MAVLLAGGATYFASRQLRASRGRPRVTPIIVTTRDLGPGATLTPKDVELMDWPSDFPLPAGSFSKIDDVAGRPLLFSLEAKQPVLGRDLGVAGSGIGLTAKIPPGMRATAVRSNEIVGVAGFLYPGSHVDVLATYTPPGANASLTQTVLQDVEVLTAGQTTEPDPQGKPQSVNVVTLLLSPEDSQRLLLISGQGSIQFVLRSGADQKKTDIGPTRLDQLMTSARPTPPPAPHTTRKTAAPVEPPKEPPVYGLEVIEGTKRVIQKFP